MTTAQKMNMFQLPEPVSGQPRHIKDIVDKDAFHKLNPQQLSKYKQQLSKEWKNYVKSTNMDFLSQNKLYLKTVQDYLSREFKPNPR